MDAEKLVVIELQCRVEETLEMKMAHLGLNFEWLWHHQVFENSEKSA